MLGFSTGLFIESAVALLMALTLGYSLEGIRRVPQQWPEASGPRSKKQD
jgi:hypothetical protein